MREFWRSNMRISVAPTSWRASIFSETSFLSTRDETALTLPHDKSVTVGDRLPGVISMALAIKSFETLYMIITYFVAVM